MIDAAERDDWVRRFGVSAAQITRDHFLSHILQALGDRYPQTRSFGGTALCRTLLDESRVSEDIDLLHPEPREFLGELRDALPPALRREFPDATWSDTIAADDGFSCLLVAPRIEPIKVYVGRDGPNTNAWEFALLPVQLRYTDLPATQDFQCPTPGTFAAMKLSAWTDRRTPRDLFDLAGLAEAGILQDPDVERIFTAKWGHRVIVQDIDQLPARTTDAWETELAAQVGSLPSAEECLDQVRRAFGRPHRCTSKCTPPKSA
jgi:predicted nucleotidyltransferase component of viral defense system